MPRKVRPYNPETITQKQEALAKKYSQDTTDLYSSMEEKYHAIPGPRMYWYLWAYTPKNKQVALGPFPSEDAVEQKIAEENLQNEIIRQYPTKQLSKATQLLKEECTEQNGENYRPIDQVIGRTKHQKSLDREREHKKKFKLF